MKRAPGRNWRRRPSGLWVPPPVRGFRSSFGFAFGQAGGGGGGGGALDWESRWETALGTSVEALEDGPQGVEGNINEQNKWPQISQGLSAGGTGDGRVTVIAPTLGYPGLGNNLQILGQGPLAQGGKVWVQRDEITADKWPLPGLGEYLFWAVWFYAAMPDGMPSVPHHCMESHTGAIPWGMYFADNPTAGMCTMSISFPPWEFWPGGSAADVHFYATIARNAWHRYKLRLHRDPVDGESARPRVRIYSAAGVLECDNGDEGAPDSFHHGPGTVTLADRIAAVDVRVTGLTTATALQQALQSVDCGQSGQGGSNWLDSDPNNRLLIGHACTRVSANPDDWPA